MNATGPIHAMLPILDDPTEAETREAELDRRLTAYRHQIVAEVLHGAADAAAEIHARCRREDCSGCRVRRDILDVLRSVADVIAEPHTPKPADAVRADERARIADRILLAADSAYGRFHPAYFEGLKAAAQLAAGTEPG